MSDLVRHPKDRLPHDEAHCSNSLTVLNYQCLLNYVLFFNTRHIMFNNLTKVLDYEASMIDVIINPT